MLPGQNGLDVCRKIKGNPELRDIPVILLTARSEEIDVVLGLELGADDYVADLRLRSSSLESKQSCAVKKSPKNMSTSLPSENLRSISTAICLEKGNSSSLSPCLNSGILRRLLNNRGKVLTRNQLLDDIHNDDAFIVSRDIDVHIAAIHRRRSTTHHSSYVILLGSVTYCWRRGSVLLRENGLRGDRARVVEGRHGYTSRVPMRRGLAAGDRLQSGMRIQT